MEFESFGKIGRLNRDMVVTEKIDGTNGAVVIERVESDLEVPTTCATVRLSTGEVYAVGAQSRTRLINPAMDNHGFARWVYENSLPLVVELGEGRHFGEWWGSGIQRGYGLEKGEKRFSLFNTHRWADAGLTTPGLYVVPVLHTGVFSTYVAKAMLSYLEGMGSFAAPGYDRPEGIMVYHTAANMMFKATILNDEKPKGLVG